MPIATETLARIARDYVAAMTSIRGRRVHKLLMREWARFDEVLPVVLDGDPALLALGDGRAALCKTDGRGPSVALIEGSRAESTAVTTRYDLLKDSLPIVGRTAGEPGIVQRVEAAAQRPNPFFGE